MRWLRRGKHLRRLLLGDLLLLGLSLLIAACSPLGGSAAPVCSPDNSSTRVSADTPQAAFLPGKQTWKDGVSSFLFGTNDTQEWADDNVETNPAIQQALKDAHFTLMRTFFFDKSLADGHATTDAEIERRIQTVEQSGMICLGVFPDFLDAAFTAHVVRYLGSRCNLYEFGNEPDINGPNAHSLYSVQQYLQAWNTQIPQLRRLNPAAKFIGPAASSHDGSQCHDSAAGPRCFLQDFLSGVKASGVLPDAISFHWYPCYQDAEASCLARATSAGQVTNDVQCWAHALLGQDVPVGISEWNYDPGNPPPQYSDAFMWHFVAQALGAMIKAKLDFANQFDAQSYGGYGVLDMFDIHHRDQPKAQFYAIKQVIDEYRP